MTRWRNEARYALYILAHPFDGYYDLKHERRGSLRMAVALYCLLAASAVIKSQFTEYEFAGNGRLNLFFEILLAVGPYLLWAFANWCLTSLMDGEGTLSDIVTATGYAVVPLIVSNLLYTAMSWILVSKEANYMALIGGVGLAWTLAMVFFGMMITQQYTVSKSLGTTFLTIVGMGILLFLALMLFYLVQQIYTFAIEIVIELQMRTY